MPKSQTNNKSLTEKVLNYEVQRLRNRNDRHSHMHQSQDNNVDRYGEWRLPTVLGALGPIEAIESVKWLGYDPNSHIYSLLYCLLRGCTEASRHAEQRGVANQDYILLKYNMYKLASETLLQGEQKIIVELLSSAEYTNDISRFLCKYRNLERIFTSMFHTCLRKKKRIISSEKSLQAFFNKTKMDHLLDFVQERFPFIGFKLFTSRDSPPEERIGIFVVSRKKMYIMECNGCHFVAQAKFLEEDDKVEQTKKMKTGIMYSKIEEQSEDYEEYEDIEDLSEIRHGDSSGKRTSFGKANNSTPKFNPQYSPNKMGDSKKQRIDIMQKQVRSFDGSDQAKSRKSFENRHGNTHHNNNHSTLPSLASIQSLIDRMRGKRFYKKDDKRQGYIVRGTTASKSQAYKSSTSLMGSDGKDKSHSQPKRKSLKTQIKTAKSIQKYRGNSPASPPSSGYYPLSPSYSPSHTTIGSPRRPSSHLLQTQVTSPVRGKKVVFTYALK